MKELCIQPPSSHFFEPAAEPVASFVNMTESGGQLFWDFGRIGLSFLGQISIMGDIPNKDAAAAERDVLSAALRLEEEGESACSRYDGFGETWTDDTTRG